MKYRPFGNTGFQVSEIGFGGSRIGGVFAQGSGRTEVINVLRSALDAGITFYDTADMYSQGESEALIGQAFRERRDQVILATKGGFCLPAQRRLIGRLKPLVGPIVRALGIKRQGFAGVAGALSQNFAPKYLSEALEGSLRRLQTDRVDLYQLHSPPASILQGDVIVEALGTLESLRAQGKIRYYGIAVETVEDAPLALACPGIASIQLPFGLLDQEPLETVLPRAAERGLGIIARGCFGGGLLKETLTEQELREMTPKWQQILGYRREAQDQGRPVLEMALQFCLSQQPISTTLLGMRTESHLSDNLRYYDSLRR